MYVNNQIALTPIETLEKLLETLKQDPSPQVLNLVNLLEKNHYQLLRQEHIQKRVTTELLNEIFVFYYLGSIQTRISISDDNFFENMWQWTRDETFLNQLQIRFDYLLRVLIDKSLEFRWLRNTA